MRNAVATLALSLTAGLAFAETSDIPAANPSAVEALTTAGAQVLTLFQDSPLLQVSFAQSREPASDAEMALLEGIAKNIAELNLARSNITNTGALAALENLVTLHLEQTDLNDNALQPLSNLENLEYLNLYGTKVTDAGLEHLQGLPKLKKLYLWQTAVSYDAARKLEEQIEGLEVNLGWDHPEVMRRRLTKELENAKKQKEDAQQRAKSAQKELEASTTRQTTIEAQLAELNNNEEDTDKKEKVE